MSNWFKKTVTGFTDALGLTDTESSGRAVKTAQKFNNNAADQLDKDMSAPMSTFEDAMEGRDLDTNLNKFSEDAQKSQQLNWDSVNAGDSANVQKYINPKADEMLKKTMQNVQGGAGAALQSSAATRTGANAVAQQYGQMWDTAYDQAMKDSSNNQNIAQSGYSMAQQNLQEQNAPTLNWAGLGADLATTKYNGAMGVGQAATTAAGQKNTIL